MEPEYACAAFAVGGWPSIDADKWAQVVLSELSTARSCLADGHCEGADCYISSRQQHASTCAAQHCAFSFNGNKER